MKFLLVLVSCSLAFTAGATINYGNSGGHGGVNDGYGSGGVGQDVHHGGAGGGDSYSETDAYGKKTEYETKCTPVLETVHEERCENYNEKVCYSNHEESCIDVEDQTCHGIVASKEVRKCFNVTELLCGLKEEVRYQQVQAVFTVQKCHKVTDRVCDTINQLQMVAKDDYQCIEVRKPNCYSMDQQVLDKTCKTTVKFDCSSGYAAPADTGYSATSTSSGYDKRDAEGYGSSAGGYGSGSGSTGGSGSGSTGPFFSSGSAGGHGSASGYGQEVAGPAAPACKRKTETKCYTTPRTVSMQKCSEGTEKICEKLPEMTPVPMEKQVCHNEEKRVCELEQRAQPKQIKNYIYTTQCRPVPKMICENAEMKQLVPTCVPTARKQCSQRPVEKCENVPRKHCYQMARQIKKQKCETVAKKSSYAAPATGGYSAPAASVGASTGYGSSGSGSSKDY